MEEMQQEVYLCPSFSTFLLKFSYYCSGLMLRGCCAARDTTLSLEGEWYETLIHINHQSVAFQVSSNCWASYLSKICIPNVFFCFLFLFPVVIFSSEKKSNLNKSKNSCMYNVYGVHFSYFVLANESDCNTDSCSSLVQSNDNPREGRQH